jgi:tRNA A-37 threonylcarbamoyl transferase component Bud32
VTDSSNGRTGKEATVQVTPSSAGIVPGVVIAGRYRLGAVIGRGGMAEVHDGIDQRLERAVAIKLLRPEMAAREDIRTRFEAEARAAARLSHPNAVAVFDTGEHDGVPFLVMERLPGETLADRIASGPVDPTWLRHAAAGVLGALEAAHETGIVHRDVKPGNILLAADGTAKIADFGIAKSIHTADEGDGEHVDLTATGQLLGTPAYLAPERLEGMPATPKSDIWAFGVVLYEALAGRKPFTGRGPLDVARAVVAGDHVPLGTVRPDLDPVLAAAVERAMAREEQSRFATAGEMAAALQGQGVSATTIDERGGGGTMVLPVMDAAELRTPRRPIRTAAAGPWISPRRLAWVLAGALVLLLLILLTRSDRPDGQTAADKAPAGSAPAATTPPTSAETAPTTAAVASANQALAQRLRDLAARLNPSDDGAQASQLAAALRRVAGEVESGSPAAGGDATGVILTTAAWTQTGQLSAAAATSALDLLRQVPGVQLGSAGAAGATAVTGATGATGSTAATNPAAATPASPSSNDEGGNGKGKGKKD